MKNSILTLQQIATYLLLLTLLLWGSSSFAQLEGGTYQVGPTGEYTSLTEVFDIIKSDNITGDVILELESNYVDNNLSISGVGYGTHSITVRPAVDAQFVLFDGRTHFTGGSVNVIFDGRPGGTGDAFPDGNPIMIFRQNDNTNTNGAIHQQGAGALTVRYVEVRTDSKFGIYSQFANTITIENCRIKSFQSGFVPDNDNTNTEAIRTLFTGGNLTIQNNIITDWIGADGLRELGGIFMLHPNQTAGEPVTWTVENNVIALDKAPSIGFCMGIRLNTSNGWTFENNQYFVRHNSILLTGTNTNTEGFAVTGAFSRQANAALPKHKMDVKNNIFVNLIENAGAEEVSHGSLWIRDDADSVLVNATFDHNNYYSASVIGSYGNPSDTTAEYATLADWQGFSAQDPNTTTENPPFTDAANGDLSLNVPLDGSVVWFIGTGVGVGTDVLGVERKQFTPTKGAYEVLLPCIPVGVYKIAADAGNPGNADYASLEEAFDDIRIKCLDGDIVLELESGFTADNLRLEQAGNPNFTVTIRPEAGALFTLFSGRTHITGGSQNIIFDGRPGGVEDAFPGGNAIMIFRQSDNTNTNGAIHQQGAGALTIRYVGVRTDSKYGIYSQFANTLTVENCKISSFQSGFVPNENNTNTEAIRTLFTGGDLTIRNNHISGWIGAKDLVELGGIFMLHPNQTAGNPVTWILENNSIVLEKSENISFCMGIRLNTSNGWTFENNEYLVQHNSVLLQGTNTNVEANAVSGAFSRQANAALPTHKMEVKNNIFVNLITNSGNASAAHGALWIRADGDGVLENADFNYNDYFSAETLASVGNPSAGSTLYASLNDWQGFSSQDMNTTNENPTFTDVANGDLSLDALTESDGWVIGTALGVDFDINGEARDAAFPTKGAYEQSVVTSLEDILAFSKTIEVFPNPTSDIISIRLNNATRGAMQISVYNSLGQKVENFTFNKNQDLFETRLNTDRFLSGFLYLVIENGQEKAVKKILKR